MGTLTSKCAKMRIPNCFSLNGSRASVQIRSGATRPQDHHWASEVSRVRLQLTSERPGNANSIPRALHSRMAAIQWVHRLLIAKLYNTGKNAVEDAEPRDPIATRATFYSRVNT